MGLPNFDEFLSAIDQEELATKIEDLAYPQLISLKTVLSEDDILMLQTRYKQALITSVKVSLLYLHQYHEWLKEYL